MHQQVSCLLIKKKTVLLQKRYICTNSWSKNKNVSTLWTHKTAHRMTEWLVLAKNDSANPARLPCVLFPVPKQIWMEACSRRCFLWGLLCAEKAKINVCVWGGILFKIEKLGKQMVGSEWWCRPGVSWDVELANRISEPPIHVWMDATRTDTDK